MAIPQIPGSGPQPGDFACVPMVSEAVGLLVQAGEWLDDIPRHWGRSPYEHALIYAGWHDTTPQGLVLGNGAGHYVAEAAPGGARYRRLDFAPEFYPGALWSAGRLPLSAAQRQLILTACDRYNGVPYSAADYFAIAAHRLHVPVPGLQDYIADTGHMICSQMVDQCYRDAGIQLFTDGRWAGLVTPADLGWQLEALPVIH